MIFHPFGDSSVCGSTRRYERQFVLNLHEARVLNSDLYARLGEARPQSRAKRQFGIRVPSAAT
jgi:hypothetical protein